MQRLKDHEKYAKFTKKPAPLTDAGFVTKPNTCYKIGPPPAMTKTTCCS